MVMPSATLATYGSSCHILHPKDDLIQLGTVDQLHLELAPAYSAPAVSHLRNNDVSSLASDGFFIIKFQPQKFDGSIPLSAICADRSASLSNATYPRHSSRGGGRASLAFPPGRDSGHGSDSVGSRRMYVEPCFHFWDCRDEARLRRSSCNRIFGRSTSCCEPDQ